MARTTELEICVETVQACVAARDGGADRVELCAALSEGGLTPSHGLIVAAVAVGPPVHVLLRPRAGGFAYTAGEFAVIAADLRHALDLGAAGVVTGVLNGDGTVDGDRTRTLVRLAGGRPVTFHRAVDQTPDLGAALEAVIAAGCDRVLTSGGRPTVTEGAADLARLVDRAAGRVRVAAGGGVTAATAPALRRVAGLDLHASLRGTVVRGPGDPLWQDAGLVELTVRAVAELAQIAHG